MTIAIVPEQALAAVAIGVLTAILLITIFLRRINRRLSDQIRQMQNSANQKNADLTQVAKDIEDLVRELDLLSRQMREKTSSQLTQLNEAIAAADKKSHELRELFTGLTENLKDMAGDQLLEREAAGMPIWEPQENKTAGQFTSDIGEIEDESLPQLSSGEAEAETAKVNEEVEEVTLPGTWPIPKSAASQTVQMPPLVSSKLRSNRHSDVLELYSKNMSTVDIANAMQMNVGEVELILNLNGLTPKE